MSEADTADTLTLTAEIVAAYVGASGRVKADEIPELIRSVRVALSEGASPAPAASAASPPKPDKRAITRSITPDALISFIDNKPYKTLKRHITRHGMDLAGYRERYGLPNDYPSVAPNYSAMRSDMARKIGLGDRGRGAKGAAAPAPAKTSSAARKKPTPAR